MLNDFNGQKKKLSRQTGAARKLSQHDKLIYSAPLQPGLYDIIADCQGEGVAGYFDDRDTIDDEETHVTVGFFVIPEALLGSIGTLSAAFAAAFLKYRKAF